MRNIIMWFAKIVYLEHSNVVSTVMAMAKYSKTDTTTRNSAKTWHYATN